MSGPPPFSANSQFKEVDLFCQETDGASANFFLMRQNFSLTVWQTASRAPTDKTHLPSRLLSLTSVGKKIVGCTACARSDLEDLRLRQPGLVQYLSVEGAQIEKTFFRVTLQARRSYFVPSFEQRASDVVFYFVAARTDRRTQSRLQLRA